NGVLGQSWLVLNAMHMIPSAALLPSCSTERIVAVCGHAATCGPEGAAGYETITLLRSIASDVVNVCAALGALDTPLAASSAVARHTKVAFGGKSVEGMKPVSLTPSLTVTAATMVA